MSKIIFLDIDGPMIPGRAYTMPGQTKGLVTAFDPAAVGLLNNLCQIKGWKIVIHSSWIRVWGGQHTLDHCIKQGLGKQYFHQPHPLCNELEVWRYNRVAQWLHEHDDVTHYIILDDEPFAEDESGVNPFPYPEDMEAHLLSIDFNEGILMSTINKMKRSHMWQLRKK